MLNPTSTPADVLDVAGASLLAAITRDGITPEVLTAAESWERRYEYAVQVHRG